MGKSKTCPSSGGNPEGYPRAAVSPMGPYRARSIFPLYYQESSLFFKSLPITFCQSTIRGHRFAGAYKESFRYLKVGRLHPVIEVPYLKGHQPHFVVVQSPDFKVISDLNAILSLPGHTLVCPATNASFVWQVSLLSPLSPSSHCPTAFSSDHTYSSSLCHIGSASRNSAPGPS